MSAQAKSSTSRHVLLGGGLAAIPESLLQAHAAGQVLFVVGAGVSRQAGLPDYRGLVLDVYKQTDPAVYEALCALGAGQERPIAVSASELRRFNLTPPQLAEVKGFAAMEYDVVLGMLERRIDSRTNARSSVRVAITDELRRKSTAGPAPIHTALIRLADRGRATTIVTTNFDLLLEAAANGRRGEIQRRSLGDIPRPTYRPEFSGVLHIHGALDLDPSRASDLVVTDQDFGEYYLHRRVVPDLIYDAARLYSLVLVGYSANDPPMRYLLNAVAADSSHFVDLKDRYVFVPVNDNQDPDDTEAEMAMWKGRGISPIRYSQGTNHEALCESLLRWAELSPINGEARYVEAEIRRIVQKGRDKASEADRDLFDHLIRRGNSVERQRLVAVASRSRADIGWLDAIHGALSGGEV